MKNDLSHLIKYIPSLRTDQLNQLDVLAELYFEWNKKVNLISRMDIDNLINHHFLHSLSIGTEIQFVPKTRILDVGTGGGLPGLPLAILFPLCHFHLVDARQKKIMVVNDIIEQLQLKNVVANHIRAEELKNKYEFILSRAVAPIEQLLMWTKKNISQQERNAWPNGYILLKGGDLKQELINGKVNRIAEIISLESKYQLPWFASKKMVYIPG